MLCSPRTIAAALSALLAALLLAACAVTPSAPTASEALAADPELSALTQALTAEGLVSAIEGADSVTIFAPTDDAFAALGSQQATLAEVLTYHVANEATLSTDLVDGQVLATLYGNSGLAVVVNGGVSLDDGASGATVVEADIEIANGVIHKIDAVLTPPESTATVASDAGLTALVDALVAAGLAGEFDEASDGPYTVFAPSNSAFVNFLAALGFADLDAFVASYGAAQAAEILQFHVLPGIVGEADVAAAIDAGGSVGTLLGQELSVSLDGGAVVIANPNGLGQAIVTTTNIVTANGVVHLIDEVLVPDLAGPTSATYELGATGADGTNVFGTVTFAKLSDTETDVRIALAGTPANGEHPAHIHVGSNPPGGGIYITLGTVDGDTGQSAITVTETDAGAPITFEELIAYDGYVNVHLAPDALPTVVATGETGAGATIVAP